MTSNLVPDLSTLSKSNPLKVHRDHFVISPLVSYLTSELQLKGCISGTYYNWEQLISKI